MAHPKFIFTALANSFKVVVENLEQLEVDQIVAIEEFVQKRKGVFDFNTYSFVIQKRLEFSEFQKLIKNLNFEVTCIDKPLEVKVKPKIGFGQYKGMQYNEIPDSYLLWLKSNYNGKDKDIIFAELKRRKL